MKNHIKMFITDEKFIMKGKEDKCVEFTIKSNKVPFVPFYYAVFEENFNSQYLNQVKVKIQEISNISKWHKGMASIYMSADSQPVDKKLIEEFMYMTGFFNFMKDHVSIFTYGEAVRQEKGNIICVSSSERAISLEVFENGKRQSVQYFNPYTATKEILLYEINKWNGFPVMICDINHQLEPYYSMGEVTYLL